MNTTALRIKELRTSAGLTQTELAEKLGLKKSAIAKYEAGLVENIKRETIAKMSEIFGVSPIYILGLEDDKQPELPVNLLKPAVYPVPILGTICAGDGVVCEQNYDGSFFIDREIKADYCLKVKGNSMTGAGINSGDFAFLKKDYDFVDGAIYAVVITGENLAVLKKVTRSGNKVILSPCNDDYEPMIQETVDVFIVGKLCGVYHVCE